MGLQARLMSQALRKLTGVVAKSNTCVIFINQIRMKIGVMFGCLHGDTLVNFVNGKSIPIGKVVDEKIEGEVWSWNEELQKFEAKPILDWHDNGTVENHEDFIHIQTESIDGKGRFGLTVTPDHEILVAGQGTNIWKKAKDIDMNDRLVSKYLSTISGSYSSFLYGMLVGDSHISIRDKNTASLRLQDNENPDYLNWKLDKLSPFLNFTERCISRGYRYDSDYSYELAKIKRQLGDRDPSYILPYINELSFAIWMMDDGNLDMNNGHYRYRLSIKRFKDTSRESGLRSEMRVLMNVAERFNGLGYKCEPYFEDGSIWFATEATDLIAEDICRYVPESMQYKLPPQYRGKYIEFTLDNESYYTDDYVEIKEIRYASDRQMRNKRKFDISVGDNHNYTVGGYRNGIVVHNSPETTTGGNALKFYSSVRMDIRRIEQIKEGDDIIGARVRVKVVKNKVAPPFKQAEFDFLHGHGINKAGGLLDLAVKMDIVKKAGTWYSYGDERIGQGRTNAYNFISSNEAIYKEIEEKIRESLKPKSGGNS